MSDSIWSVYVTWRASLTVYMRTDGCADVSTSSRHEANDSYIVRVGDRRRTMDRQNLKNKILMLIPVSFCSCVLTSVIRLQEASASLLFILVILFILFIPPPARSFKSYLKSFPLNLDTDDCSRLIYQVSAFKGEKNPKCLRQKIT